MAFESKKTKKKQEEIKKTEQNAQLKGKTTQSISQDHANDYTVVLEEQQSSGTKEVGTFAVKRATDENGGVFLVNEETGFEEELPNNDAEYKLFTIKELTSKIETLSSTLDRLKKKRDPKINIHDVIDELKVCKRHKSSIELEGEGSYLNWTKSGKPYYRFERVGSFKFPVYRNTEKGFLSITPAARVKKCSELMTDNRQKNSRFSKTMKMGMGIMFFLTIIAFCAGCFFAFKMYSGYTESAAEQLQHRIDKAPLLCAEMYGQAGENFIKASEYAVNLSKTGWREQNNYVPELNISKVTTKD